MRFNYKKDNLKEDDSYLFVFNVLNEDYNSDKYKNIYMIDDQNNSTKNSFIKYNQNFYLYELS